MEMFTIRTYGILINANHEVLISDERRFGLEFTKFPGGGLTYGEGTVEALKREFKEECGVEIDIIRHVYTTDFFVKSAFNDKQVIGVYYQVSTCETIQRQFSTQRFDFKIDSDVNQVFRWIPVDQLQPHQLTFDTDRMAWRWFMSEKSHGFKF